MILYFTGTGNSLYVAKKLSAHLGEKLLNIGEKIRANDFSPVDAEGRLVFVVPTYAWRIPRIVEKWIEKTEFQNAQKVWFVMDCGGEIGNAEKYIAALCERKQFDFMGVYPVVMPENYVALFPVPDEKESAEIIEKAAVPIEKAAKLIENGESFPKPRNNLYDRFMSGPVNPLFYSLCVKAKAFKVSEKCVGCGKCEKLCPLGNINLKNNQPVRVTQQGN